MFFLCDYACAISFFGYNAYMTKIKTTYRTTIDFLKDCDTVVFNYSTGKSPLTGKEMFVEYEGEVTLHDPEIHEDDCPEGHVYILCDAICGMEEFPFGMPVHEDDIVAKIDEDGERIEL